MIGQCSADTVSAPDLDLFGYLVVFVDPLYIQIQLELNILDLV